jgi:hypothetical protein
MTDVFVISHRPSAEFREKMREADRKRHAAWRVGYMERLTPEYVGFLEGEVARLLRNTNASQR